MSDPFERFAALGAQTAPQLVPPSLYGLPPGNAGEDYCAQVLGRICDGALEAFEARGNGLLVNYDQLPDALFTRILPHFGVSGEEELRLMAAPARYDVKAAGLPFAPDMLAKRQAATPAIRAACRDHLDDRYARLERLGAGAERAGAPGSRSISR